LKHQTIHKELKHCIKQLRNHEYVKKVIVGRYENCRHKYPTGTLLVKGIIDNGLKIFGYDGSGVHNFYVYVEPLSEIQTIKHYIDNL